MTANVAGGCGWQPAVGLLASRIAIMTARFCVQCGAALPPAARFCTACGQAIGGGPTPAPRLSLVRWAPLLVLGVVGGVGGIAVGLGSRWANPPNVPPPRTAAGAPPAGAMPPDHPPLEVPADVRNVIAKMADAAKAAPDDLEAWKQLGFVQYRAGQVDPTYLTAAATTYGHVLEKAPRDLDALRALGNIAYDRDQPQQALDYYRRYLAIEPGDLGIQTDLATMLLATQQVDAALEAYQAVLRADPTFFQAQFNLALAYRAKGDDALALAALRRAREVAKDDETRQRVDALLARVGVPAPAAEKPAGTLRTDVEAVFRSHPIAGSRIDRIEWPGDSAVRVVLREFPMDGMPAPVRETFVTRLRNGLREGKRSHQATAPLTVELVDAGTGRVMETFTE